MIMVSFRGATASEIKRLDKEFSLYKIGNVILYNWAGNIKSPKQLKNLTQWLQEKSGQSVPMFIAVDQEGGKISRLSVDKGFRPSVSARYLGLINNVDTTRFWSTSTAECLQNVGININLAPVVDLNIDPKNPIIGKYQRSFSPNAQIVEAHASTFIKCHREKHIFCAIKHFPGHGSSTTDSHIESADISSTWNENELEPYRELIQEDLCDMVMLAHVYNSKIDSIFPATLSKATIEVLLRKKLNFKGITISDDLNMKAIKNKYSIDESIELAINAGIDIILLSERHFEDGTYSAEKAFTTIKKLVEQGKIPSQRIDESYKRIVELKKRLKPSL